MAAKKTANALGNPTPVWGCMPSARPRQGRSMAHPEPLS